MSAEVAAVSVSETALKEFLTGPEGRRWFAEAGFQVRDRARVNARPITDKVDAIISETGVDAEGVYADVGYAKHAPGFFLWWWEVGTRNHRARPHLRPALRPHG